MTDEEKGHYAALKTQHPNAVLLLKTTTGQWAARHVDMDHVLSVYPDATACAELSRSMSRDFVTFEDRRLDAIITSLNAKGVKVARAEPVKKAPKGETVERLVQGSLVE